jgi:23S rRNA (adenine1618-N6)-methyltransferase
MKQNDPGKNAHKTLHPRNRHREGYDFPQLIKACPELASFVFTNPYDTESIDFSNPDAVKMLNKALLRTFYGIAFWDLPAGYLCPPVPGRADYIHYIADLLAEGNEGVIPRGKSVRVLDIGVGANCIYPIIGHHEYGWRFVGTDTDPLALRAAKQIASANKSLSGALEIRQQPNASDIFTGILKSGETFDVSICNPPFHASPEEAQASTERKWKNLGKEKTDAPILNFGGQTTELWYPKGEEAFIQIMVSQSAEIPGRCRWFSTLISKKETLPSIYGALKKAQASEVRTIEMNQGQKTSRVVAWTFMAS